MPNWHDDDCDCDGCRADEDRFWREQGEGADDHVHLGFDGSFSPLDEDADDDDVDGRFDDSDRHGEDGEPW